MDDVTRKQRESLYYKQLGLIRRESKGVFSKNKQKS